MCFSSLLAILGEMVCCIGQQMTWEQVLKSELSYRLPRYGWDVEPSALKFRVVHNRQYTTAGDSMGQPEHQAAGRQTTG